MGKYAAPSTQKMDKEQPKGKNAGARRRLLLWLSFMVIFMGWAGYTFFSQSAQIAEKSSELSKKQATKDSTDKTKTQLKYEVNRLQDPEYIGQLARKKYGLYLPGETPIRADGTGP